MFEFGTKFLLRYVNSARLFQAENYINYWSRFWRLRRCMLIWVPLPVPTWTPYSVKVFSFLISIGAAFCLFMYIYYLFHFIFAFSFLTFFCRLYRRQLLYCCPPRIAPLIVGNKSIIWQLNKLMLLLLVVVVVIWSHVHSWSRNQLSTHLIHLPF